MDVSIPWVRGFKGEKEDEDARKVFHRYYHLFAVGELAGLVYEAALEMGLAVGTPLSNKSNDNSGIEIVQDGWERSNYYVELKRWRRDTNA